MYLRVIFIAASLFDLVRGWNDTSPTCVNVLIEDPNGDFTHNWIHVVSSCPENYTNEEIRRNCEKFPSRKAVARDIFLFTLVQGSTCKGLYYNVYCAICNDEIMFNNFPPLLTYQVDGISKATNTSSSKDHDEKKYHVLRNLRMNLHNNEYDELISIYNKVRYEFKIIRSLHFRNFSKEHDVSLPSVIHSKLDFCKESKINNDDAISDTKTTSMSDRYFKNLNRRNVIDLYEEISHMYETRKYAANQTAFCPEVTLPELESCKYVDADGNACLWSRYLVKGVDFTYGENWNIFLMKNHSKYDSRSYSNGTGMKNVIYFCKPKIQQGNANCIVILDKITSISRRMSLFFVILYLCINSNRTYLSNLADKFTYSYYLTLLVMYIREEIIEWWPEEDIDLCFLKYYAYKYLSLSYSIWILICSYYVWYIIRFSKEEITTETSSRKSQLKIYLKVCLFGWILPAISSFIFYHSEPNHSCPYIEKYNSLKICQRHDYKNAFYWFTVIIMCTISVTVVVLFADACYCYYFAKSIYNRYCKFNALRARMVFLFKIVYSIGLYSVLAMYSLLNLSESATAILTHLWSFHGTVLFFVYSFKITILKQIYKDEDSEDGPARIPTSRKISLISVSIAQGNCVKKD